MALCISALHARRPVRNASPAPIVTESDAAPTIQPEQGTLEITGDTVVIRYTQLGVEHQVVYAVDGPHHF